MWFEEEISVPPPNIDFSPILERRQVFTVPGNSDGVFVTSVYDLGSNILLDVSWIRHSLPNEPRVPQPDHGQVHYHEGMGRHH